MLTRWVASNGLRSFIPERRPPVVAGGAVSPGILWMALCGLEEPRLGPRSFHGELVRDLVPFEHVRCFLRCAPRSTHPRADLCYKQAGLCEEPRREAVEARGLRIRVWQPARGQQFLAKPVHRRSRFPIRVGCCVVPMSMQQGGAARAKAVEERLFAQVHAKNEETSDIRSLVAVQI